MKINNFEKFDAEKRKKQTRSLDKAPFWLRGVSHEFFLDSEKCRNPHTVEYNESNNYKNVSILNQDINSKTPIKTNQILQGKFHYFTFKRSLLPIE